MRTTLYGLLEAAIVMMWMFILSTSLSWMNKRSDVLVFVGAIVGLASCFAFYFCSTYTVKKWYHGRKKKLNHIPDPKILLAALLLLPIVNGCYTVVSPGHVGIKVNMSGDARGVNDLPLETGRVFYNPFTETVFEYPTFVQTVIWTKNENEGRPMNEEITFTTQDQMQVGADISLAYRLIDKKVPAFYVMFRSDDLSNFTHGFMHNLAREKFDGIAGKYKIEQIMGDNLPFLNEVRGALQKSLDSLGIQIEQFGLTSAPRPPQSVIDAINAKVGAVQNAIRVENEVRQAEAEAKKKVALADGEAQANMKLTSSISDKLLEWRRLAITEQAVNKWDGRRPTVEGSGSGLLLQLSVPTK